MYSVTPWAGNVQLSTVHRIQFIGTLHRRPQEIHVYQWKAVRCIAHRTIILIHQFYFWLLILHIELRCVSMLERWGLDRNCRTGNGPLLLLLFACHRKGVITKQRTLWAKNCCQPHGKFLAVSRMFDIHLDHLNRCLSFLFLLSPHFKHFKSNGVRLVRWPFCVLFLLLLLLISANVSSKHAHTSMAFDRKTK